MKIALLCSGLGRVLRGHEVFARGLFDLVANDLDITLFKGGGSESERERVIPHVSRDSTALSEMTLAVSEKWRAAAEQVERMRVEGETFAYAAIEPLLIGRFDVFHCLEQEVCRVLYANRHLFAGLPRILWSNGGALTAPDIPPCDFVQEHTEENLRRSRPVGSFVIPHGVDTCRFRPGIVSGFRRHHGIPEEAFVVISVGTICYWHKRMDHVIEEVSRVPGAWLVIAGQEGPDTPAIKDLGRRLMGERVVFCTVPHDQLPEAYAAADVFTLGSLFETFGIVYIEAMAMGLPVICTAHPNQRSIVKEGIFVDMSRRGQLTRALTETPRERLRELGRRGVELAREHYDLHKLKKQYLLWYQRIADTRVTVPQHTLGKRLSNNARNLWGNLRRSMHR